LKRETMVGGLWRALLQSLSYPGSCLSWCEAHSNMCQYIHYHHHPDDRHKYL
jgi:hypothetical protein